MTLYTYLGKNKGQVRTLYDAGLISTTVIQNFKVYKHYVELCELGNSKSISIGQVMEVYGKSQRAVYKVLKQMEQVV